MPYSFGKESESPHLIDAPLTERGREEARETQKACEAVSPQPEYLVVSPLERATETGLLCWEHRLRGGDFKVVATDLCREG